MSKNVNNDVSKKFAYCYKQPRTNNQGFETPTEKLWLSFTFIKSKESKISIVVPSFSLEFTLSFT